MFAGGLVTLLVITGLVIDGGMAFLNRRDAQNVADLAAIAGTKMVADHYTDGGRTGADVYGAAAGSVSSNGCSATGGVPCSWRADYVTPGGASSEQVIGPLTNGGSIPAGAQGLRVYVTRQPETFFLGLIGQLRWDVQTTATALTARIDGLPRSGVLPIAADPPNANFKPGGVYNLTAGKDGPGNFSWLSWDGSNDPNTLADSICNPDNPAITFPAWVTGDPGKSNSSGVRDCVDRWIAGGETVLIPLWDRVQAQGNNFEFRITGLAAVVILERGQPAVDSIIARFSEYYPLPSIEAGYGGPPASGDQVYFLGLVR